jgi:hypothetical protein
VREWFERGRSSTDGIQTGIGSSSYEEEPFEILETRCKRRGEVGSALLLPSLCSGPMLWRVKGSWLSLNTDTDAS